MVSQLLENEVDYDAIIHIGLAEKSLYPRIERVAKDILDMRIEDNSGRKIVSTVISGSGDLPSNIQYQYWKNLIMFYLFLYVRIMTKIITN